MGSGHSTSVPPLPNPSQTNRTPLFFRMQRKVVPREPLSSRLWNSETGLSGPDLPRVPWVSPAGQRAPGLAALVGLEGKKMEVGQEPKLARAGPSAPGL